jgi:hypothetical protein
MIERTYHEVLSTVVHEMMHPLLAMLTPHVCLYIGLGSRPRDIACKEKKRLQIKYIYKQQKIN